MTIYHRTTLARWTPIALFALAACSAQRAEVDPETTQPYPTGCEGVCECIDFRDCESDETCISGECKRIEADHSIPTGPRECTVRVESYREKPLVVLIQDQSGSMWEDLDAGVSRWGAVQNAYLGSDGLLEEFREQVVFSLALYTAYGNDQPHDVCPIIAETRYNVAGTDEVAAALETSVPIYNGDTPTGDAVTAVHDSIRNTPDPYQGRIVFILATDGEPDTCEVPDPQNGQGEAIAAVRHAFDDGIPTFALSVGDDVSDSHMQALASAGAGGDPAATYFRANSADALYSQLRQILGNVVSCQVEIPGGYDVQRAEEGLVTLNGRELAYGEGFTGVDDFHLELLGAACDELKTQGSVLTADFPCDVPFI